jgi:hypothetical protein
MKKAREKYRTDLTDQGVTLRALPYRPTGKLRRTQEPAFAMHGWRTAEFRDARGNFYERERDGEWERWFLVTEKRGKRKHILFEFKPEIVPVDFMDALDRYDDLQFLCMALHGLIDDAEERKVFGLLKLDNLRSEATNLGLAIEDFRHQMEALKPPEPPVI